MEQIFIGRLMEELKFPQAARQNLAQAAEILDKKAGAQMQAAETVFFGNNFPWKEVKEQHLNPIAEKTGLHPNTVDMLFLLNAAKQLRETFRSTGIGEDIFLATMEDLRYKLMESWEVYGVWGTFVGFWYDIFFQRKLLKLGRLEYEDRVYERETPYEKHGICLKKGDPVKSIHIPSSGPLSMEACMASYKQAYEFFQEERNGGPLICICHSWLLHPSTAAILPENSNTVRFLSDFDIIAVKDEDKFDDQWRVFGKAHEKPFDQLPEDTSMRRAYKKYLAQGGKTGHGYGVLIFDGEKLLTRQNHETTDPTRTS